MLWHLCGGGTGRRDKLQTAKVRAEYLAQINQQLHTLVKKKLAQAISDTPAILDKQLNWQDESTDLIDLLTTPSATISKVEAVAAGMPWLYDELLKLVNAPQNRRRDARGMVIVVDLLQHTSIARHCPSLRAISSRTC